MAFTLPHFNLQVNIWRNASNTANPPDVTAMGNLALGRRTSDDQFIFFAGPPYSGNMWLLLPKLTDVRGDLNATLHDHVEVPAGSGRFYDVIWVDDAGKGFPNEHRVCNLLQVGTWPSPIP